MVHTRGRQTMIEPERSRLEQILAKHGQRWQIECEGLVWTATEHPSPTPPALGELMLMPNACPNRYQP